LDDTGVEVHVRVELLLDEVIVFQGDLFQRHGQLEEAAVFQAQFGQHVVADLAHQLGPGVEVLVDPVTEAHELEGIALVLGAGDVFAHPGNVADFFQHLQAGFIGATVSRAPQTGDTGRDTGEGIGTGGASQTHRGGGGVLLVIGVEGENHVQGVDQHRIRDIGLAGGAEHHLHEVGGVVQVVARIHQGLTAGVLVSQSHDGGHLGHNAVKADAAMFRVGEIVGFVIKGGQGADHANHYCHGVGVPAEALEELHQLFVHHRVGLDGAFKI